MSSRPPCGQGVAFGVSSHSLVFLSSGYFSSVGGGKEAHTPKGRVGLPFALIIGRVTALQDGSRLHRCAEQNRGVLENNFHRAFFYLKFYLGEKKNP